MDLESTRGPPFTDGTAPNRSLESLDGEIEFKCLKFARKIGSGGYKDVYRGFMDDAEVAIGVVNVVKLSTEDVLDIENEAKLLKELRHDNIVRFLGIAKEEDGSVHSGDHHGIDRIAILTEFCVHGDLSDYMQSRQRPSMQKQFGLMYDIAFGTSYLHGRRPAIIHRDLKSLNILVDTQHRAKITDFGFAKVRKKARGLLHSVVGTINWQAPEMWREDPEYSEKVDVYACGLIFWEILQWSNKYPFSEMTDFQIYEKVGKKHVRPSLHQNPDFKKYPKSILNLIEQMWQADPDKRPNMMEVVQKLDTLVN